VTGAAGKDADRAVRPLAGCLLAAAEPARTAAPAGAHASVLPGRVVHATGWACLDCLWPERTPGVTSCCYCGGTLARVLVLAPANRGDD
jgi:hypothetical protein